VSWWESFDATIDSINARLAAAILLGTAATTRAESVMKQCGEQWQAAKAAGTTSGATPAGGNSHQRQALPKAASRRPRQRLLRRQRNRVHCFRGSGQQLRLLEAPRRPEPRRRRKLNTVVPDRRSFGSMSTRTSTISREHAITATQKAALTCARRTRKLQAIAPR
jgi:hypothetical protein